MTATLPRGLLKRGDYWHMDKTIGGVRHRVTLGVASRESAIARFNAKVEELRYASAPRLVGAEPVRGWAQDLATAKWPNDIYVRTQARAKSREIDFGLSKEEFMGLLRDSGGFCQLTGIPFNVERADGQRVAPFRPSIDRINPSGPYHADNCRIVCAAVNVALSDFGDRVFHKIALGYVLRMLERQVTPPFTPPLSVTT